MADIKPVAWVFETGPGTIGQRVCYSSESPAFPPYAKTSEPLYPQSAIDSLRAEVEDANADFGEMERLARKHKARAERAEAEVERLREALAAAPGGHSCEEFHHSKADRHLPGEPCPPQERWNAARAALGGEDERG